MLIYSYVMLDLMQPLDSPIVLVFVAMFHVELLVFFACWLSIASHGPGRVSELPGLDSASSEEEARGDLPEALAEAFKIGRFCEPAFGPKREWCSTCAAWRPPLATHCHACGTCNLWLDHHNYRVGHCIGFLNFRSYMQFFLHCQGFCIFAVPVSVMRLSAGAPVEGWLIARLLLFGVVVATFGVGLQRELAKHLKTLYSGWPFRDLYCRFEAAFSSAQQLRELVQQGIEDWSSSEDMDTLTAAIADVKASGTLRGLFAGPGVAQGQIDHLVLLFGDEPSFWWFVPFLRGGYGDPLRPTVLDKQACLAWGKLATIMEALTDRHIRWVADAQAKLKAMEKLAER